MRIVKKIILFVFIFLPWLNQAQSKDSSFIFTTKSFNNYTPASLGNGYFSIESSLLGIKRTGSYMARVYDHADGDIPRIARLPAWNEVNYFDGKYWLDGMKINDSNFSGYEQTLDMLNGVLKTEYIWQDNSKSTLIKTETFISRENKNLAAVKFQITPRFTGNIKIFLPLKEWKPPKRKTYATLQHIALNPPGAYPAEWYPGYMKLLTKNSDTANNKIIFWIVSKAVGRSTYVAEAANVDWPELKNKSIKIVNTNDEIGLEIEFSANANQEYTFYKYISAVSSFDTTNYLELAKDISSKAKQEGYNKILNHNNEAWNKLWKTDIKIYGNPQLQKAVHSMMFYLFCSIRAGTNFSIPPMGLANDGYYGHIFWDADTFMFPALLLMHPEMAESMVNFRFEALDAAKANAKLNGYKGAMYPWESDEIGNEATPGFAYQNALHENHITGDVALAQWQYYLATGNKQWLADTGYSVIKETADFWTSRVSFNKKKDRFEIKNVVSVDEGKIGINNDTYTNSIAKKNLEIAIEAGRILNKKINHEWINVKDKIYIPFDSVNQIYPTYENAPDSILGAVVTLLSYPIGVNMSETAKVNNLKSAAKLVKKEGSGAMMTITLLPVIAAAVRDANLLNELTAVSYKPYLHPPYNVLTETPHNHSINFITGAGGFLQQIIYGYTGLRITEDGVKQKYKPMLPHDIQGLTLQNFYIGGTKYDIEIKNNVLTMTKKE